MTTTTTHWSFWPVSLFALFWFGSGAVSLVLRFVTDLSYLPFEALPLWATFAVLIAVFSGLAGAILLLRKNPKARRLFIISLLGSLAAAALQFLLLIEFGALGLVQIVMILLWQIAVPVFLVWYTGFAVPAPLTVSDSPAQNSVTKTQSQAADPAPAPAIDGVTSGFFVFDYNVMDTEYGQQAFAAIYPALRSSQGECVFHEGDVFDRETVLNLAKHCRTLRPSSPDSPLANLDDPFTFGAYFAAMWTDEPENFDLIHKSLVASEQVGYLGYMAETLDRSQALRMFGETLMLPAGMTVRNGKIDPGTNIHNLT